VGVPHRVERKNRVAGHAFPHCAAALNYHGAAACEWTEGSRPSLIDDGKITQLKGEHINATWHP
jgi:hypothetical protein